MHGLTLYSTLQQLFHSSKAENTSRELCINILQGLSIKRFLLEKVTYIF